MYSGLHPCDQQCVVTAAARFLVYLLLSPASSGDSATVISALSGPGFYSTETPWALIDSVSAGKEMRTDLGMQWNQ